MWLQFPIRIFETFAQEPWVRKHFSLKNEAVCFASTLMIIMKAGAGGQVNALA